MHKYKTLTGITKEISFVATLKKWCKVRKLFEAYDPVGDVYLRDTKDAEMLARVWNPSQKSIYKVSLMPCKVFSTNDIISISHLYPVKFYSKGELVGKVYVNVKATAERLVSMWKRTGRKATHPWMMKKTT